MSVCSCDPSNVNNLIDLEGGAKRYQKEIYPRPRGHSLDRISTKIDDLTNSFKSFTDFQTNVNNKIEKEIKILKDNNDFERGRNKFSAHKRQNSVHKFKEYDRYNAYSPVK